MQRRSVMTQAGWPQSRGRGHRDEPSVAPSAVRRIACSQSHAAPCQGAAVGLTAASYSHLHAHRPQVACSLERVEITSCEMHPRSLVFSNLTLKELKHEALLSALCVLSPPDLCSSCSGSHQCGSQPNRAVSILKVLVTIQ